MRDTAWNSWDILFALVLMIGVYYGAGLLFVGFEVINMFLVPYFHGMIVVLTGISWLNWRYPLSFKIQSDKHLLVKNVLPYVLFVLAIELLLTLTKTSNASVVGFLELDDREKIMTIIFSGFYIPFMEEWLYRGLIYRILRHKYNFGYAALLSALIFWTMHFDFSNISPLVAGVLFAWIYEKTKEIWACILTHMAWNISIYLYLLLK